MVVWKGRNEAIAGYLPGLAPTPTLSPEGEREAERDGGENAMVEREAEREGG